MWWFHIFLIDLLHFLKSNLNEHSSGFTSVTVVIFSTSHNHSDISSLCVSVCSGRALAASRRGLLLNGQPENQPCGSNVPQVSCSELHTHHVSSLNRKSLYIFLNNFIFQLQLTYNIMLVSDVQHGDHLYF